MDFHILFSDPKMKYKIRHILHDPIAVCGSQFNMIADHEKNPDFVQDRIADLNILEDALFYSVYVTCYHHSKYEYSPIPHKDTKWVIPERFKPYLDGGSNEK